jgi:hypothetical protein
MKYTNIYQDVSGKKKLNAQNNQNEFFQTKREIGSKRSLYIYWINYSVIFSRSNQSKRLITKVFNIYVILHK